MRIAHVVPSLSKGGGERVAVDLANWAVGHGHRVTVIAGARVDEGLLRGDLLPGVEVRYVARRETRWAPYLGLLPWLWRNRKWLADQDILHCHMTFAAVLGTVVHAARRIGRGRRPAVVETYHAVGMPIPALHRRLHAFMARRRDGLILMAEDPFWSRFLAAHPRLPSAVIPNGIVIDRREATPEERLAYRRSVGIPDGCRWVVGTIGRLQSARRPWLYPRIFAAIAERLGPDVHFLIGGEGPERGRVEAAIAEQGLDGRVHLPGLVLDPSLPLSAIDLYLTLNVGPVTGIAALEAAASGRPVLAMQFVEGYQPSERDWIWSSTDLDEIGRRAADLLADPAALGALAERQRAHVAAHRTVEAMAKAYFGLYSAAAAGPR
jgi:glycosyltransferase involved in cell wall biosynthesis